MGRVWVRIAENRGQSGKYKAKSREYRQNPGRPFRPPRLEVGPDFWQAILLRHHRDPAAQPRQLRLAERDALRDRRALALEDDGVRRDAFERREQRRGDVAAEDEPRAPPDATIWTQHRRNYACQHKASRRMMCTTRHGTVVTGVGGSERRRKRSN